MIKVDITFVDQKKFNNLIRYIENNAVYGEAQEKVRILGHHTADNMIETIKTERKRPDKGTHHLENSITAETLSTTGGVEVGIGRISKMTQEAPYWEVLNNGGYIPNHGNFVPLGAFSPGEAMPDPAHFREGNWTVGADKYTFRPKTPLEGIDYIGKAIRNLDKELKLAMEQLGTKFITDMSKASNTSQGKSDMFGRTYVSKWGTKVKFGPPGSASGGAR